MAYCGSSCPYHWHDDDCEYCSARGDEVIDLKKYDYDTCPYYQRYRKENHGTESSGSGSDSEGSFFALLVLGAILYVAYRMFFG